MARCYDDDIKRRHKQFKHMVSSNMPFQKGNQLAKNGPMRRDLTVELIMQLNEILESPDGRTKLHGVVKQMAYHMFDFGDEPPAG